jgi:hypothetical protein
MKNFNFKLGDIVHCVQDTQSFTLHAEVGKNYKIVLVEENQVFISTIDYDETYGKFAAIVMPHETFFQAFISMNEIRKQKLNKLNK